MPRRRTVADFTDPYLRTLTPPPPAGDGVCDICHGAPNPGWTRCYSCAQTVRQVSRPTELVIPISLYEVSGQLHYVLRNYKDGYTEALRRELRPRVTALLWRFLAEHGEHIAEAAGQEWEYITSVPSSGERRSPHPLEEAIGLARPLAEQYEPTLIRGEGLLGHNQASDTGYRVLGNVEGHRVLVVDDTFTSGARIQSAASALTLAGADVVGAVVLGRVINPAYNEATRQLWDAARARPFDFSVCCLEETAS